MKLQNLAIIFVVIILPISLVLTSYTKTRIETINMQAQYDSKLNDATHDALKAYQINNFSNETSDLVNSKMRDIKASVNTFFNSMSSNFGSLGYTKTTLQNYVPAIVYTMYDGYYIYSPYTNTWDDDTEELVRRQIAENEDDTYEPAFESNQILYGLKPYIYYSCRYANGNTDVVITYSLDNYIQIQGKINNVPVSKYGYLLNKANSTASNTGVWYNSSTGEVKYNGIVINEEESLKENIYVNGVYYENLEYIKKNGTKYYIDKDRNGDGKGDILEKQDDYVFSILNDGTPLSQSSITSKEILSNNTRGNCTINGNTYNLPCIQRNKKTYYIDENRQVLGKENDYIFSIDEYGRLEEESTITANDIKNNSNAKSYYIEAYELMEFIEGNDELRNLSISNIIYVDDNDIQGNEGENEYTDVGRIFSDLNNIESEESNFNIHRIDVIKHSIIRNLSIAISNFNNYSSATANFQMPLLKGSDWDKIMDNISIISFFQGANIGGKVYNGYSIVTNTKNEDVVMEDSIYIQTGTDNQKEFHRITETGLENRYDIKVGIFNVNIERRSSQDTDANPVYYFPVSGSLSYNSIVTQNGVSTEVARGTKLKDYISDLSGSNGYRLKQIYYLALGRERYSLYRPKLEF